MFRPITRRWGICFRSTKIHRLGANTEKDRSLPHGQRTLVGKREGHFPNRGARVEGEAFDIHTRLYKLLYFFANEQESM